MGPEAHAYAYGVFFCADFSHSHIVISFSFCFWPVFICYTSGLPISGGPAALLLLLLPRTAKSFGLASAGLVGVAAVDTTEFSSSSVCLVE